MKTERMVLLVTPEEKARINNESMKLGVSASEYIRKLVGLLDAEDVRAADELALLAPELAAMADRLDATFADFNEKQKLREERWDYLGSPEYRESIRREVLEDPTIDWPRMRALLGGDDDAVVAA